MPERAVSLLNHLDGPFKRLLNQFTRKKSTKINFLGPETAGLGGPPREGVGVEEFVPSFKSSFSFGFEGGNLG